MAVVYAELACSTQTSFIFICTDCLESDCFFYQQGRLVQHTSAGNTLVNFKSLINSKMINLCFQENFLRLYKGVICPIEDI